MMSVRELQDRIAQRLPTKRVWLLLIGSAIVLGVLVLWLERHFDTAAGGNVGLPWVRALDLSGRSVDVLQSSRARPSVFVFVSLDCPISNSYLPEVRRLADEFASQDVTFWLVYPNADETPEMIRKHLKEYGPRLNALRDPRHELTKAAGARVTPEASVFLPGQGFVYRGRIDDRFVDFGKSRHAPTQRDLKDALTAIVKGKPVPQSITRAVGCYISELP